MLIVVNTWSSQTLVVPLVVAATGLRLARDLQEMRGQMVKWSNYYVRQEKQQLSTAPVHALMGKNATELP